MTNKQWIENNMPTRINAMAMGGVVGCPDDYGLPSLRIENNPCSNDCNICWQLQITKNEEQ